MAFFNNQFDPQELPPAVKINYYQLYQKNSSFAAVKFISECCVKLGGKIVNKALVTLSFINLPFYSETFNICSCGINLSQS